MSTGRLPNALLAGLLAATAGILLLETCGREASQDVSPLPTEGSLPDKTAPPKPVVEVTLPVSSRPEGAEVWLDGEAHGTTPVEIQGIRPGPRRVVLQLDRYWDWEREILVSEDRTSVVAATLEMKSPLRVYSEPPGAEVRLDGASAAVATPAVIPLDIFKSSYELVLELEGYETWQGEIDTSTEGGRTVRAKLQEKPMTLSVVSVPGGATVHIAGESQGATPLVKELEDLPKGSQELRLTLEGFLDHQEQIQVRPGGRVERSIELKVIPQRASILKGLTEVEEILGTGLTYIAARKRQALDSLPGWDKVLTSEDTARSESLTQQLEGALPAIRFSLVFPGGEEPFPDALGPPQRACLVVPEEGRPFVNFKMGIESSATDTYDVCLLQVRRKEQSILRVVPHPLKGKDRETQRLEGRWSRGRRYQADDGTRPGEDDLLYCLFIFGRNPSQARTLRAFADTTLEQVEDLDGLAWARELTRLLESFEGFQEGDVFLRTILVRLREL